MVGHNYPIDELFDYDKHGNVIVYDADLLDELVYVEDKTEDDIDWLNTGLVRLECPYKQMNIHVQKFENNLDVVPNIPDPEGYKSIFIPFSIDNNDIPLDMKNLGVQIKYEVMDYFAEFDSEKQRFIFIDKDGNDVSSFYKDDVVAYCDVEHNSIQYNIPRILFKKDDYEKYANPPHENLKNEIEYLNSIKEERNLTLVHELKHIKNNLLIAHRMLRDDYHALSAENMYKQRIEDERTAAIAELIYVINKYQKAGNYNDSSVFMGYFDWIANDIKGKKEKEIQSYFKDIPAIVNKHLLRWTKTVLKDYQESAISDATYYAKLNPLAPNDVDDKEYNIQRSLMYSFNIYNPETKKEEVVNLAKYIDVDIPISESVQKGYVYPFIEARENVRNKYQKNKHKIKFSLIKYYKKMCLKNIKKISQSLLDINRNNSVTPVQQDTNSRKIVCNSEERKHSAIDTREPPSLLDLKLLQNKFNRR